MSTPGLSLVGFIADQTNAINHLRNSCVPDDPSDAALLQKWADAKAKLGAPIPKAGMPDIQPISAADAPYIQQLKNLQWVKAAFQIFGQTYQTADFKMIEIEPLLAYQFHVDADRSSHHCQHLVNPTSSDLLPVCLPQTQPLFDPKSMVLYPQQTSVMIKSRNLSLQRFRAGPFEVNMNGYQTIAMGMQMHVTMPFVHVVRFNGRCYLHNGFHRAYGARMAGAQYIPCLLRDVRTPAEAGILGEPSTFPQALLESGNPPTVAHFTEGRAFGVKIRAVSRVFEVMWSENVVPDEYDRMLP